MRKGHSPNSKNGWCRGIYVPGAFKLDHLQPLKPILYFKFSNFLHFHTGAISYYPSRLIMRKGNSPNSKNGWYRGIYVPGALKLDHLQPVKPILLFKFSNFSTFILGSPIPYYPRELKKRKWNPPNLSVTEGFQCLGQSNWTICSLLSQFC